MEHTTPPILPRPEVIEYIRAFARSYRPESPRPEWPPVIGKC